MKITYKLFLIIFVSTSIKGPAQTLTFDQPPYTFYWTEGNLDLLCDTSGNNNSVYIENLAPKSGIGHLSFHSFGLSRLIFSDTIFIGGLWLRTDYFSYDLWDVGIFGYNLNDSIIHSHFFNILDFQDTTYFYQNLNWSGVKSLLIAIGCDPVYIAFAVYVDDMDYIYSGVTSIEDRSGIEVHVYPNPFDDIIRVGLNNLDPVSNIEIINSTGQTVFQNNSLSTEYLLIDGSSLPQGLYFLKLFTSDNLVIRKIIKAQ